MIGGPEQRAALGQIRQDASGALDDACVERYAGVTASILERDA
jgi:hypothetical protein